jgi:hypothetical protein
MSTFKGDVIGKIEISRINGKEIYTGLTKKELFTAMAMQGLCACSISGNHKSPKALAKEAVEYADALFDELNKDLK